MELRHDVERKDSWTVGEVARLSRVSVRTLHHYEHIGLVSPTSRSSAGYRLYSLGDLQRLQHVLAYRALDFPLGEIAVLLDDPELDTLAHLRRQRDALAARAGHLSTMIETLERTMDAHRVGIRLTPQEMLEVFGDDDPSQHAAEAEERWGDTDAFAESTRRSATYGKADWIRVKEEGAALLAEYAASQSAGEPADSVRAMDVAEANRQHISRWFYACSPQMHRGLGDLYVADERFAAYYDAAGPGLSAYVRDAVHANADRQEEAAG